MENSTGKFVIHVRKSVAIVIQLLLGLFFLILGVLGGILSPDPDFLLFGIMLSLIGVILAYRSIFVCCWKCTVEGDNIRYQSLFRRKIVRFSDIKKVTPKYAVGGSPRHGIGGSFVGVDLYSEAGKLFHIHGTKVGFRAFVARLEEQNIPGAEKLPKGIRWH